MLKTQKILLLDSGIGNIQSVANVLEHIGANFEISHSPDALESADKVIFPGVGTYGNAMEQIEAKGWYAPLRKALMVDKKPGMGICVGMQIMSEIGTEFGTRQGLGIIPGTVKRIDTHGQKLCLPHVGWNDVQIKKGSRLFKGISDNVSFYFLHSYHFVPTDPEIVSCTVDYGSTVVGAVEMGNIFGVQFHPEKSQEPGIQIFRNFLEL